MPRMVNQLLVIVGVIVLVIELVGGKRQMPMMVAGLLLLILAFVSDWVGTRRAKEQRALQVKNSSAELVGSPWGSHQSMSIKGSVWISIIVLLAVLGSAAAVHFGLTNGDIDWPMTLWGVFFLAVSAIPALRIVPNTFKPALQMSTAGLVSPIHGSITWHDVDGIHLSKRTHKGVTTFWLQLLVNNYQHAVRQMHWSERLLCMLRGEKSDAQVISIRLLDGRDKPEVVFEVARHLWKQVTGNTYSWYPGMSAEFNAATKQNAEILAKMQAPTFIEQAYERRNEIQQDLAKLKANSKLINEELIRSHNKGLWLIGVLLVSVSLTLAWGFLMLF